MTKMQEYQDKVGRVWTEKLGLAPLWTSSPATTSTVSGTTSAHAFASLTLSRAQAGFSELAQRAGTAFNRAVTTVKASATELKSKALQPVPVEDVSDHYVDTTPKTVAAPSSVPTNAADQLIDAARRSHSHE